MNRCRGLLTRIILLGAAALVPMVGGCQNAAPLNEHNERQNEAQKLSTSASPPGQYEPALRAICLPPNGWAPDPLKRGDNHTHRAWLSPTGKTAYGVIHFKMPLPVGPDMALWGYLRAMKKAEGDATLLSKQSDPKLPGIRFVAEGGQYKTRDNLIVSGSEGWAIYAGTLRGQPEDPAELQLAEQARERTRVGN